MPKNQNPLFDLIADRIRQEGPVSVSEYMALALGHPEHGYYMTRDPFGVKGDFTTAPEISQMFGEMIGAWLVDAWLQMGKPENVHLVELGPGRGTLAADIMRTQSFWPEFRAALHLVETSPKLREEQAKILKNYSPVWHDSFSSVPEGLCFVVANEFFDALPVRQFEKINGEWRERCVGYDEGKGGFYFTTRATEGLSLPQGEDGAIFETSPASLDIFGQICGRISKHGGAALIMDYGHAESGLGDTVQAVSRHRYSDPLKNPGENDITAHVDFGALAALARHSVNVAGPVTQGRFLVDLGIEARAQKLGEGATVPQRKDIMAALCRFVAPQAMGRLFKVMALTAKTARIEPAGFGARSSNENTDD